MENMHLSAETHILCFLFLNYALSGIVFEDIDYVLFLLCFDLSVYLNTDLYFVIHQTMTSYLMDQAVFVACVAVRHYATTPT